ncbi:MAG: enoyl-CoA hydratase-related protein, partial [Chloroflexota bacterium]|nr:enoyl-CoA hydratase-related protein [Chloroflexota bacterium]
AVVLTGAGKAFCSGADVQGMVKGGVAAVHEKGAENIRRWLREGVQRALLTLHRMEKPTIGMINGLAMAAGFDIACTMDIRVGSENTRFCSAFIRAGLFPGSGGTWLMSHTMPVSKALELMWTGDFLEAKEAKELGLLTKLVPAAQLEQETMALARKIALGPPVAIRLAKLQVYQGLQWDLGTAMEVAALAEPICFSTEDHKEAMAALLAKRQPRYKGR